MKVLKVFKSESKKDKRGNPFHSIRANVLYTGGELTAFINSYVGDITAGAEIDDSLAEQKEGEKGPYLSVFLSKPKKYEQPKFVPGPEPEIKISKPEYTGEELQDLMTKCLEYYGSQLKLLETFGVSKESLTFIVGSLFNTMKERGIRAKDWVKIAVIAPDGGFADGDEIDRQRMIAEIKDWLEKGKITQSALTASRKLVTDKTLTEATLAEVRDVYNRIKPAEVF